MTIDILCKIVDNFGDIGVVFRLAKALSATSAQNSIKLRIIIDKLEAFQALEPSINPGLSVQEIRGWTVVRWDTPCELFLLERPRFIVEAFACGRPDWYEAILFDEEDPVTRRLVNLEYLSAEAYTEEMHCIPSLTRSHAVKKYMFMPGFSPQTGGLILDPEFLAARSRIVGDRNTLIAARRTLSLGPDAEKLAAGYEKSIWISVFSYEHDYAPIVADLAAYHREKPIVALIANGRGADCFLKAWAEAGAPFPIVELPFLPQAQWDEILLASDFSIVRGEESLARAALCGHPFLWHAYLQDDEHHLVKVEALLDRMEPFFGADAFASIRRLFLDFNKRSEDHASAHGNERLWPILSEFDAFAPGFAAFSEFLLQNGDLAKHLLTFFCAF